MPDGRLNAAARCYFASARLSPTDVLPILPMGYAAATGFDNVAMSITSR